MKKVEIGIQKKWLQESSNEKKDLFIFSPDFILVLIFITIFIFEKAVSLEAGNFTITPSILLKNEYDSNVNLADGKTRKVKEDLVLYLNPGVVCKHHYLQHITTFNFETNYRKGMKTDLSNVNLNIGGNVDLKFPAGLQLKIYDKYMKSAFDQALWDEVGIFNRLANKVGTAISYIPLRRFLMETQYDHTWNEYEYQSGLTARTIDNVSGKMLYPFATDVSAYFSGGYLIQKSKERLDKNYNDSKVLAGIKWNGPYRFNLWFDLGYQDISYNLPALKDYRNMIGNIGLQIKISEMMNSNIYAGSDGYSNIVFGLNYKFDYLEQLLINFLVKKETISSFSWAHETAIFEYTKAALQLVKRLYLKFTVSSEIIYQLQDSENGNNDRKNHTWIGNLNLYYPIQDWLKVGVIYQYSERYSFSNEYNKYEFKDNRIGFYLTLSK
jgi:hypothetical protein